MDWLDTSPDLPHLFARLSELVHLHGYAPEDLVVIPRAEVDRRETAAFTSGWIEAVSEELPRIRREYEKRVADAYAHGQQDARGVRRPQRRMDDGADGARVIALPFARLLEPPAVVVEAEERVRRDRERERFDGRTGPERKSEAEHATAPQSDEEPRPHTEEPATDRHPPPSGQEASAGEASPQEASPQETHPRETHPQDASPQGTSPQESGPWEARARRTAQAQRVRKVVRGKGGRPIVPPLTGGPGHSGSGTDRRGPESAEADTRPRKGRRLSERARALEGELAERAQEAPPESTP
ncbi:hypothetical protein [Streptomyces sp. NPDC013457]|uniref:hypothetical protein n=1 Tax=Streptomyces sp. NPDC013457 TaxID=3364866 RepID=UPI0036F83A73